MITELKNNRRQEGKFTVIVVYEDYGGFAEDGLFPDVYEYYRVDTEEELVDELNKEDELFPCMIETIYYGFEDVTDKYLEFVNGEGNELLDRWYK